MSRITTRNVRSLTVPDGISLAYNYDGSLPTGTTWSGPVAGSVSQTYDNNFRITSQSVNGANTISFGYDIDSLLTSAGSLTIARNAQNGLITGTTLGVVTHSSTYNTFGELSTYTANLSGSPVFSVTYTRDTLGRITQKLETLGGVTTTVDYAYDTAGRLKAVTKNGTVISTYAYDANGNRLSLTMPSGTVTGTYDAQDRLTQYGATAYSYTANGDLHSTTTGGQTTTYQYDVRGNLTSVVGPTGFTIEYVVDGQNRRIGKKVNGTLVQGFLYQNQLNPVAELDGTGAIVSRFVYGSRANVPDYMVKGGVTYRIISDHLGSPRLIVDVATGAVAQQLAYDEFGHVLTDIHPGFQPFGFAGGLYDPDTGLVRFGARDYDAETGRWTTKDQIRFGGGDTNLYGYVLNDPVNRIDLWGLTWDDWHEVTGTIEGTTTNGLRPTTSYGLNTDTDAFVALPSEGLQGRRVEIEANGITLQVPVGDVGPWNGGHTRSGRSLNDPYWENNQEPQAACGTDLRGRRSSNRAGIDISHELAGQLGLTGTSRVRWRGLP